jgi:hypothetical protein
MVALAIAGSSHAGTPSLEVISAWGGPVNDVEVASSGNTAYIAAGRRFVIADIANLAAITEIGSVDLRLTVRDIAVNKNLAYVATGYVGGNNSPSFHVVDVSNPSSPSVLWDSAAVTLAGNDYHQVRLHGDLAYLRHGHGGGAGSGGEIDIYDLSQPTSPVYLGYITNFGSLGDGAEDMEIVGDRLYVVTDSEANISHDAVLSIYDLTAPDLFQPPLLGSVVVAADDPCEAFAIDGNYAFLSISHFSSGGPDAHIAVVDVSNPAAPTIISSSIQFAVGGNTVPHDIGALGGHLYVVDNTFYAPAGHRHALRVYDVASNPTAPIELSAFETHGNPRDIVFSGGHGWVLDDGEGAVALNITNPASLVRLGHYYSPAILLGMDKAGSFLYVVDAWNGFTILDVSNPTATPTVVGVFQTPAPLPQHSNGAHWQIDVVGTRAYFTAGLNGFMVVDVSSPAAPSLLFTDDQPHPWAAKAVQVMGNVAYVTFTKYDAGIIWGMRTYDITNNSLLGAPIFDSVDVHSIAVNPQGFVFAGASVPKIVNASNPSAPFMINANAGPTGSNSVALDGDVRLLACEGSDADEGVRLDSVTNPANPALLSLISAAGFSAFSVAVQNHRAYFLASAHCYVYDISNPQQPQAIVTLLNVAGRTPQILVDEPHLYIATGDDSADGGRGVVVVKGENLELPPVIEQGKMYWVDLQGNAIRRANTNGTGVETILDATDGLLSPRALALDLDAGKMYFTHNPPGGGDDIKIQRASLDGTGVSDVVTGLFNPDFLCVDHNGGKVYWARSSAAGEPIVLMQRANLDGNNVETLLTGLGAVVGFDLDLVGGKVYRTVTPGSQCLPDQSRIERCNLDGTNVQIILSGLPTLGRIAIDAVTGKMYWHQRFGTNGSCSDTFSDLVRANLDGTNLEVMSPLAFFNSIDIDHFGGKVYFIESGVAVKRANLDGSGLESLITAGISGARSIRVVPTTEVLCPADIAPPGPGPGNGVVNIDDLLLVISNWGQGPGNPADVNGNGTVNIDDLLAVISAWGPCK